jgi:hypothetical protein
MGGGSGGFSIANDQCSGNALGANKSCSVEATFANQTANIMFITSASWQINTLGGLAGADQRCQDAASGAGLGGTYVAWLSAKGGFAGSVAVDAKARLTGNQGWVRVDGRPFADTVAALAPSPAPPAFYYPPVVDENGVDHSTSRSFYPVTGTYYYGWSCAQGGGSCTTCDDYQPTATAGFTEAGYPSAVGQGWTMGSTASCTEKAQLYCFGVNGVFTGAKDVLTTALAAPHRYAFVTDTTMYFAFNGGRSAADALCQAQGGAKLGSGNTYRAFLAANTFPAADPNRFSSSGAIWLRPDGVQILPSVGALFTSAPTLIAAVAQTADGGYMQYTDPVVLGGTIDPTVSGTLANTCNDWTSNDAAQAVQEASPQYAGAFTNAYHSSCNSSSRVLCLQN